MYLGRTGSGKSSIFQALFRIVDIQIGTIRLFGADTKSIEHEYLRSVMSLYKFYSILNFFLGNKFT